VGWQADFAVKRQVIAHKGPLSLAVCVAKDPAANELDVTANMGFTGFDWKVTGLVRKM
jgi:hypothetical protein